MTRTLETHTRINHRHKLPQKRHNHTVQARHAPTRRSHHKSLGEKAAVLLFGSVCCSRMRVCYNIWPTRLLCVTQPHLLVAFVTQDDWFSLSLVSDCGRRCVIVVSDGVVADGVVQGKRVRCSVGVT
jgi:hypothetical protein